jgi:hypothetical protein
VQVHDLVIPAPTGGKAIPYGVCDFAPQGKLGGSVGVDYDTAMFSVQFRTALGAYLDCGRARPDLVPQLQGQVATWPSGTSLADGNVKWAILLMWTGTDPRSIGPTVDSGDDPEMFTSAMREACSSGHVDVLKWLRALTLRRTTGTACQSLRARQSCGMVAVLR